MVLGPTAVVGPHLRVVKDPEPRLRTRGGGEAGPGHKGQAWSNCRADQLATAATVRDLEAMRRLLDVGTDPNAVNSFGRTPIQVGPPSRSDNAEGPDKGGVRDSGG
ncbi:UNVERIFIED_CONTAM: hypothetical protein K2H54_049969 [Gekko kuhli]